MARRRRRRGLSKVLLTVIVVGAVATGFVKVWHRLGIGTDGSTAEARADDTLDRAESLLKDRKAAEALLLLDPLADKADDPASGPRILLALAEAETQMGNGTRAEEYLTRAVREFPQHPDQPKAAVAFARALEHAGRHDEAGKLYEKVRSDAPPEYRSAALAGLGRREEARNRMVEARDLYRNAAADAQWDSPDWREALEALGRVNVALIFSHESTPESQVYTVQKGDSLTAIGSKLNTTQGLLTRANGIAEDTQLVVGHPLKYTPKDFKMRIERSKCRLFLLDNEGVFKVYSVGLGMPGHETALGTFTIGNKEKDPTWHKPGEGPIPPGDPRNELGTRWMPLLPTREGLPTDLGIHGTIHPDTVGSFSSHGCARLRPADVEELYDLVVRGTPVEIVESVEPVGRG